eukprot:COSAG01_NODE_33613_length_561_cov_1.346320_2_plen_55_part_00
MLMQNAVIAEQKVAAVVERNRSQLEFKVTDSKLQFEEKREAIQRLQKAWKFDHE